MTDDSNVRLRNTIYNVFHMKYPVYIPNHVFKRFYRYIQGKSHFNKVGLLSVYTILLRSIIRYFESLLKVSSTFYEIIDEIVIIFFVHFSDNCEFYGGSSIYELF